MIVQSCRRRTPRRRAPAWSASERVAGVGGAVDVVVAIERRAGLAAGERVARLEAVAHVVVVADERSSTCTDRPGTARSPCRGPARRAVRHDRRRARAAAAGAELRHVAHRRERSASVPAGNAGCVHAPTRCTRRPCTHCRRRRTERTASTRRRRSSRCRSSGSRSPRSTGRPRDRHTRYSGGVSRCRTPNRRTCAVGLELADAASDVVAVVAVGALVAVEARRALPDELAVELAAAEREVAVRSAVALRAGDARGGAGVAVAVEAAARIALLPALDDAVAAGACGSSLAKWNAKTQNQEQHADRTS